MPLVAQDKQDKRLELERKILGDLRTFCRTVMDYDYGPHNCTDQWKSIYDDPFLDDLFEFEKRNEDEWGDIILVTRGALKSTILSSANPARIALTDPSRVQVLIVARSQQLCEKIIGAIKQALQNPIVKKLWGYSVGGCVPDGENWSYGRGRNRRKLMYRKDAIQLIGAKRGDPTIIAMTPGRQVVGLHPTHIVVDDICSAENVRTINSLTKLRDSAELLIPLLFKYNPSDEAIKKYGAKPTSVGKIRYVGTRYSAVDLYYTEMQKRPPDKIFIRSCWADSEKTIPAFKSLHTRKDLDGFRQKMGAFNFCAQYEMNPFDASAALFTPEMFIRAPRSKFPKFIEKVISVDPTNGTSSKSDEAGVIALGTDKLRIYKIDEIGIKQDPTLLIETIMDMCIKYDIHYVIYESLLFQSQLGNIWDPIIKRRGLDITVIPWQRTNLQSKTDLLIQMRPTYTDRRIIHDDDEDHVDNGLEAELCLFNVNTPRSNRDNLADAMQQGVQYLSQFLQDELPDDSDLEKLFDGKVPETCKKDVDTTEQTCDIINIYEGGIFKNSSENQCCEFLTSCFLD